MDVVGGNEGWGKGPGRGVKRRLHRSSIGNSGKILQTLNTSRCSMYRDVPKDMSHYKRSWVLKQRLTSVRMLKEGYAERHKHQPANYEVGWDTVYSVQDGHQRPPLLKLIAEVYKLPLPQDPHVQPLTCALKQHTKIKSALWKI